MRGVFVGIGVFVASFLGVWVLTAAVALAYGNLAGVSQAEGAFAMGAIFMVGPAAGLIGSIIVTALVMARRRRRGTAVAGSKRL